MNDYVVFSDGVVYRGLEVPHLFHVKRDELYELEGSGLGFVEEVESGRRIAEIEHRETLDFALEEGLVEKSSRQQPAPLVRGKSPLPSLRYLEVLLTTRCNLKCRHCYLGEGSGPDLDPSVFEMLCEQFDRMQGLRMLLSGGEPLLYRNLDRLGGSLKGRGFRVVLLTNGLLLDKDSLAKLPLHEVQVSLDGMQKGHEEIRGEGTFGRAVDACRLVVEHGLDLSVATMIHPRNVAEMEDLEGLVEELGVREWSLEVPTRVGRWSECGVSLAEAASCMSKGFGGSYHGSSAGYACGHHLAAVTSAGSLVKCGFYADLPLGQVKDGLLEAWLKKPVVKISEVETCAECEFAAECGGGCRYRAGGRGPDLVMCAAFGKIPV